MEASIICRACLTKYGHEYIELETFLSEDTSFLDCFNYCTRLQANLDDELPSTICFSCAGALQIAYDFIKSSTESEQTLRNSLVFYGDLDHIEEYKHVVLDTDDVLKQETDLGAGLQYNNDLNASDNVEELDNVNRLIVKEELEDELPEFEMIMPTEGVPEYNEPVTSENNEPWGLVESDDERVKLSKTLKSSISNSTNVGADYENHITGHIEMYNEKTDDDDIKDNEDIPEETESTDIPEAENADIAEEVDKEEDIRKETENADIQEETEYEDISDEIGCPTIRRREHFICAWCGEAFSSRSELLKHRQDDHQGKVPSSCLTCGELCSDEPTLRRHVKKEHGIPKKAVECPYCKKQVKAIAIHIKYMHPDVMRIPLTKGKTLKLYKNQCPHCFRYFQSPSILSDHVNTHTGDRPYACGVCGKKFQKKTIWERHEQTVHLPDDAPKQKCDYCDYESANIFSLKSHISHHRRPKTRNYLCSFCPSRFMSPKKLQTHEDYKHRNGEKPYNCDICGKGFYLSQKLKQHKICVHTKGQLLECPECKKVFKNSYQLKAHIKIHTSKQIPCPQCDKKFLRNMDLRIHMRSHTGETPYQCHLCDKKYSIKVRLTYHLQRHMGYKHKCTHCPAEFGSRNKLRLHSFKHFGMPYVCEVCQMGYPNRVGLRRHAKSAHRIILTDEDFVRIRIKNEKNIVMAVINEMDLGLPNVSQSQNDNENEIELET